MIAELRYAEDVRLAWTLLAASLATVLLSAPMLRAHFAETIAKISIRRKHPGEPHALRQGILCYGLPGLLCVVALFAAGIESAMFAHASWVALRILITPRAVSS